MHGMSIIIRHRHRGRSIPFAVSPLSAAPPGFSSFPDALEIHEWPIHTAVPPAAPLA
jgi:hypothetical protein